MKLTTIGLTAAVLLTAVLPSQAQSPGDVVDSLLFGRSNRSYDPDRERTERYLETERRIDRENETRRRLDRLEADQYNADSERRLEQHYPR